MVMLWWFCFGGGDVFHEFGGDVVVVRVEVLCGGGDAIVVCR